jgi:predicted CoA-binding protein
MTAAVYQPPSDAEIRDLLRSRPVIALVGASSKLGRASHGVMRGLLAAGYTVIPVNPNETQVHGQVAYPDLAAVPVPVEVVDVFRRSEETPAVARSAVAVGAKVLWLQVGVINEEAARIAREGGLRVVMDRCLLVEHGRLAEGSFGPRPPAGSAPEDR